MRIERGILVHPEELTLEWLDWMADAGLNTLGLHPVGGRRAHESLERAIREHALPARQRLFQEANARGIAVNYEGHALGWLLPTQLFEQVPEWFRMDEHGRRVQDFNLCASSGDALRYVADRTAMLARLLETGSDEYSWWLDDVTGCACHCPACRELSPSDQQLRVVNAMLTGLQRVHRGARLCYLAYHDAMAAPTRVLPLEGVYLEYAPMRRDFARPIGDPACEKNAAETAELPGLLALFGTGHAKVLEYWMDNSMYSNWTKPPKPFHLNEEVMRSDVAYYAAQGFTSLTSFGCYLGPDYRALHGRPPVSEYGAILVRALGAHA